MPFDGLPQNYETKPEVFSLEGLIAWLETQPGETEYNFADRCGCLMNRYCTSNGVEYNPPGLPPVRPNTTGDWRKDFNFSAGSPQQMLEIVAGWGEHTYSAALQRARSLLSTAG